MGVSAARLPESHQGSEVGSQHGPAEGRHRVDSHQAANEGALAALEQGHDVGTHVVSVLLPEVLDNERGTQSTVAQRDSETISVLQKKCRNTTVIPQEKQKSKELEANVIYIRTVYIKLRQLVIQALHKRVKTATLVLEATAAVSAAATRVCSRRNISGTAENESDFEAFVMTKYS